ncbi:MAG: EthD domain-containing protein [Leptolyngbyaceae cyanobacterium]
MIKLVMCLKRNPILSREEFQDYWKNHHAPLFMRNAHIMRTKKYVQSHTITSPLNEGMKASRGMMDEYDGVAEVWFESELELMEVMGTEEMSNLGQVLMEDEQTFIDHRASCAFIVNEIEF